MAGSLAAYGGLHGGFALPGITPEVQHTLCQGPAGSPRGRSRVLPIDGHQISPVAAIGSGWAQARGTTPWPVVAWASRTLSPVVTQRWAWCKSRSTVAPAMVLGMISSKPEG